jgi:hypothetical protein
MKHENQNIEELLNSYIDGELTERENTEVQRLISHDGQVAQRLRELEKSKMLVSSLPRAKAPAKILEGVRASLGTEILSLESTWSRESSNRLVGMRHLMFRKILAAAAMIGLVAILSGVIYTIVAPEPEQRPALPAVAFNGRLELKTGAPGTVNTFMNKMIEDKGLSDSIIIESKRGKNVYNVTCSRENLNTLLAGLGDVWERFDSAMLFVETKTPGKQVLVDDVSAKQIIDLITPVKPDLTGPNETIEKTDVQPETKKQVHLIIVVEGI